MKLNLFKLLSLCAVLLVFQGCQTSSNNQILKPDTLASKPNLKTTQIKPLTLPKEITLPTAGVSKQHNLSQTSDGKLIASWVESKDKVNTLRFAIYDNASWQPVQTVTSTKSKLAASPVVMGLDDGSLAAFWMQAVKDEYDPYAAEIFWVQSEDNGLTWSQSVKPYPAAAKIYDAQMSLTALPDAKVALVWTDSRFVNHNEAEDSPNKTSRYQLMSVILNKDRTAAKEITLDNDVCSCCRAYTAAANGQLITVYRDHLPGEIRDISAVRWNPDSMVQASPVHKDNWVINGCPSNGPAVAMSGTKAAVAWFSAGDGQGKLKLGFADKDGAFRPPVVVDDHAIGFTDTVLLDDGTALVSWRSLFEKEEKLMTAKITPDGKIVNRTPIHSGSFPRWPSNYLAMQKAGDNVYIAWTDASIKKVRLMSVPTL